MQQLIFRGLLLCSFFLLQFCGQHDNANEHMNRSSFEKLVERFEDPQRETWQKPDSVIAMLGDLSGKTIAEIGAGTGYFSFRIAPKAKKVIAIDIDRRFLDYMGERIANDSSYANVEPRMAAENNPGIKPRENDITLLVNTYHHIEDRVNYFGQLRKSAKTGMKLVVVDFKKGEHPVGPPHEIKLSARDVQEELRNAGYAQVRADTTGLPYQYIVTAIAGESAAP